MINVWWLKKPVEGNFGDLLTPHIFEYFKINYNYTKYNTQAISVGSIARHAVENMIVLGSGVLSVNDKLNPKANWRLVRGPYTRLLVLMQGGSCPQIYGDPALILPEIWDAAPKKYDIGIVPHLGDKLYVDQLYPSYHRIDITGQDVKSTNKSITECRFIISSSLHGIIAAHAYGIPAAWVKFGNRLEGDDIKFFDYYASVGLDCKKSTITDPDFTLPKINLRPQIKKIFEEVRNEFN
jgi:pyruvyltransferase